jgi:spore coat protein U-like protein
MELSMLTRISSLLWGSLGMVIAGTLIYGGGARAAATVTSTFPVNMTITAQCVINSASTLNFGSSGVIQAAVTATSTIQVQCTNTTPYDIGLDVGNGTGATVATRKMTKIAGTTLDYSLYSDSSHVTVWGNTIGSDTVTSSGTGSSQSFTVYGQVPVQSTSAPGSYTDTITVTVTY